MIAFDDAGLAQVFVAATAVPPEQRRRWLAEIAKRLERGPPSRGSYYVARHRQRVRDGLAVLQVEVEEVALAVALVDLGLLPPDLADDRAALSKAAGRALSEFCNALQPESAIRDSVRLRLISTALGRRSPRGPHSAGPRTSSGQVGTPDRRRSGAS
jgi:hypothetical protein